MALPSGTVTFLFTDIAGSTSLWEREPVAMRAALDAHNQLLNNAFSHWGGSVFKVIGDAYQVAFDDPLHAIQAAIETQITLANESWVTSEPIRVRIGLHTGPAEVQDNDYAVSHTLNRTARIAAAGHGGQILISLATAELTRERLPDKVALIDLGEHYLKGLSRQEHIYQVVTASLASDFPPLVSLSRPHHNLPNLLSSFIGREKEIQAILRKVSPELRSQSPGIDRCRMLTLTGVGGVGKSRLAIEAAWRMLDDFTDGIWLVELAPLTTSNLVLTTFAGVLGIRDDSSLPLLEKVVDFLRNRNLLVILDNCEHVIDTCADLVSQLLKQCSQLIILATTREPLGIEGEVIQFVPSLSTPREDQAASFDDFPDKIDIKEFEALQLFVERAKSGQPNFRFDPSNAAAIIQICRRLDGIPLAIELAAARVRLLDVQQIAARLDDAFRLLAGGSRTALPRQQTLRAAIDWSYNLLSTTERVVFRRLAVFAGGFTIEAAEEICSQVTSPLGADSQLEAWEVLDLLSLLVNKSLVSVETDSANHRRYRLLETIRQYSQEKLAESGEADAVHRAHHDWFIQWVESGVALQKGAQVISWINQIDTEIDNLRMAREWAVSTGVGTETSLRLASGMHRYWWMRGNLNEGYKWLKLGLTLAEERLDLADIIARGFYTASWIASGLGMYPENRFLAGMAVQFYRQLNPPDKAGLTEALAQLGTNTFWQSDHATGRKYCEEAIAVGRDAGVAGRWSLALALWECSELARVDQNIQLAADLAEESWLLFLQTGDAWNAGPLMCLGDIARRQKRYDIAKQRFEHALKCYSEVPDYGGIGAVYRYLTILAMDMGDKPEARRYYLEAARIEISQGNRFQMANLLEMAIFSSIEELLQRPATEGNETLRKMISLWVVAELNLDERPSPDNAQIFIEWFTYGSQMIYDQIYDNHPEENSDTLTISMNSTIQENRISQGKEAFFKEQEFSLKERLDNLGSAAVATAIHEGHALTIDQASAIMFKIII